MVYHIIVSKCNMKKFENILQLIEKEYIATQDL